MFPHLRKKTDKCHYHFSSRFVVVPPHKRRGAHTPLSTSDASYYDPESPILVELFFDTLPDVMIAFMSSSFRIRSHGNDLSF